MIYAIANGEYSDYHIDGYWESVDGSETEVCQIKAKSWVDYWVACKLYDKTRKKIKAKDWDKWFVENPQPEYFEVLNKLMTEAGYKEIEVCEI